MSGQYWENRGATGLYFRIAFRTLQFIFAFTTAIIYGIDLHNATAQHKHANASFIFAEVVSVLSIITCLVHCLVTVTRVSWCMWDFILAVMWAAQTGTFGTLYLMHSGPTQEAVESTTSVARMKSAVGIDLVSLFLWLMTAIMGCVWCCSARRLTRRAGGTEVHGAESSEQDLERCLVQDGLTGMVTDKTNELAGSSLKSVWSTPPVYDGHKSEDFDIKLGNGGKKAPASAEV